MPPEPPCVLVVDDEPIVRAAMSRSLSRAGYCVVAAATAEEALDLLELHQFSFAVTDWHMPGRGGRGFLLEAAELLPDLPVIVMTADDELVQRSSGLPSFRLLPKPWAATELRAAIARVAALPSLE